MGQKIQLMIGLHIAVDRGERLQEEQSHFHCVRRRYQILAQLISFLSLSIFTSNRHSTLWQTQPPYREEIEHQGADLKTQTFTNRNQTHKHNFQLVAGCLFSHDKARKVLISPAGLGYVECLVLHASPQVGPYLSLYVCLFQLMAAYTKRLGPVCMTSVTR